MPKYSVISRYSVWYEKVVYAENEDEAYDEADKIAGYGNELERSYEDGYTEEVYE